jgi:hypothetical protein
MPSTGLGRTSSILAGVAIFGAGLWPLLVSAEFLIPDAMQGQGFTSDVEGLKVLSDAIPFGDRLLALTCYALPTSLAVWGLVSVSRLFRAFAQGQVFSQAALGALYRIATALALNVVTGFVTQIPVSYFLTRDYPGHHGAMGFGVADVVLLFVAGATYVFARVLADAKRVAEENASFV